MLILYDVVVDFHVDVTLAAASAAVAVLAVVVVAGLLVVKWCWQVNLFCLIGLQSELVSDIHWFVLENSMVYPILFVQTSHKLNTQGKVGSSGLPTKGHDVK